MKFKIIYLVYFCLAIAVISSSLAYSEIMPGGYTGAPGEGTCASCHSPANPDMDGEIRLRGIPVNVFSGATHTATVTVLDNYTDGYNAGFQLVALDASNQNAGFLSNPDASMNFSTENGRTYASHAPKKMLDYDLDPPQTSWSFDWTAPTVTENTTVTFWYTGLIENEGSELNLPLAGSKTVNIIAPVNVQLVSQNTIRCNGGNSGIATVISNSGLAPITYQWSNGQVGATLQGVGAGSYTVTATDAVGQTDHLTVTFTEPPVLSLSLEFTDLSCAGANDGFIQAFGSGGTPGYTFFWSNGQVGPNISNLSPGFYQVTMTDSNNCSLVQSTTIGAPAAIDISLQSLQPIDCAGAANGSILVSAIGGTGGLTYQWSNGLQGAQIQNLPAGNYGLTVTDANNCTATRSVEVQEPEALAIQIENLENASCFGEQDGQIITTVSGGTLPYNFSWSNEQQGQDAFNLGAGSYTLSITDANNCQTQRTFLIEQPPVLTTTILNIVPTSCFAFADGRAEAVAEGGTPPYSYAWSNGGTSALISNLPAGAYSVSISDAEGCSRVD